MSHVWILCDVYENDLAQVHLGEFADIHLVAYPEPRAQRRTSATSRQFSIPTCAPRKVRLDVENPGLMRFGMFVTATFHGATQGEATPMVPAAAILHLARPRLGLYADRERKIPARWRWSAATCCPATCRRSSAGSNPGAAGRRQCAGFAEHRGAVDDPKPGRFRAQEPLSGSGGWPSCCSRGARSRFISFPVEAYPDVANNYVEIITQWPGISAEQIEQQVTIPLEIVDERHSWGGAPALVLASSASPT